jgi:phage protein D
MDTTGPAKEGQQRHWDEATVETILRDAARFAEVANVQIDPALRTLSRSYFEMRDESFAAMGERLAREIGANFRIVDDTVILSRRNADYTAAVRAAWGDNLHSWDIAPQLGRPQFSGVRARWYDVENTGWQVVERATGLDVRAVHSGRLSLAGPTEAIQQTDSDAATAERDAGEGSVVIEGNTAAIPDGLCIVSGTRPGVDGAYRIEAVTHTLSRAGGFVTALELRQPRGGAGADPREATTPTVARAEAEPRAPPIVDPDVSGPQ